jgi:hypothetical protein
MQATVGRDRMIQITDLHFEKAVFCYQCFFLLTSPSMKQIRTFLNIKAAFSFYIGIFPKIGFIEIALAASSLKKSD